MLTSSYNQDAKSRMEQELTRERPTAAEKQREIVKLKKVNQDLTAATKKLEMKVKTLEKRAGVTPVARPNVTSIYREREADVQRQLEYRDHEILKLKDRLKDLCHRLKEAGYERGNGHPSEHCREQREVEAMLKLATRERMQLERQLAIATEKREGRLLGSEAGREIAWIRSGKGDCLDQKREGRLLGSEAGREIAWIRSGKAEVPVS
ncbi:unnamed protein product [Cyprideis torosa]|uniref:Uncharacterized protein n=1 Tax=Cyprideis torosa TaxID=163714 RepID=A0A7R8WJY9_9CRUS|nr:unnamed protein product [Cyprideis torosa]CAG0900748.1 unnamed protein product [Cyprideis torosa]